MLKKCNNCGFQQDEFLNLGGRNYCKSCNSEISNNNTKIQDLDNLTAYDKKVVYDMFYMSIEWLEKYIEIAYKNEFPDWESRKQVRDNLTITRTDIYSNPEKAKKAFSTQMFLFGTSLEDMPILREDLKKEFCQWISAVKVDDSFPNELKHILYGFNEVMDGNIEKVRKDMANRKREYEIGSPGYMEKMAKLFTSVQVPMHNERETKKSLGNKTHLDVGFRNRFGGGSAEQGEQTFSQIAGSVASRHDDFHFYPQKGQQIRNPNYNPLTDDPSEEFLSSSSQEIRWDLIISIGQSKNDWEIRKETITYDRYGGERKGDVLILKTARLGDRDYNQATRELINQPGKVYRQDYFNEKELAEINAIFVVSTINWELVNNIKQNSSLERDILVFNKETGEYYEKGDWFIHNSLKRKCDNKTGYLIYVPNAMVRAKDLNEMEQKEVGYKLQTSQTQQDNNRPQGGSGGKGGGYGSSVIWGSFTVISLIGLAFTKNPS